MLVKILKKDVGKILAASQGARDGSCSKDFIEVNLDRSPVDAIREKARFDIHRFDSDLYDSLVRERLYVTQHLDKGHRLLKRGSPKAADAFKRAFDLQDELVNGRAFSSSVVDGNALLNEGINAITTLICGGTETAFNNANAQLGVGTSDPTALTGTVTFTLNSKAVSGTGTAFTTELAVGDWIRAATSTTYYRVAAITSDTALTLDKLFEDTTETGVAGYMLDVSLTDLPGTPSWKGMDSGYPTFGSAQQMVFQSVFGSTEGNHVWKVFGVRNGATANKNLNMKFSDQGTKSSGQTWTLNLTIDLI